MDAPEVGAVVVGAGIAGLAAALELQRDVGEVVVIDASDRPGGVMRTDHAQGYVLERGPNTILVRAPMLRLLRSQSLDRMLEPAQPVSRRRFVYFGGELAQVPTTPAALLTTSLLTTRGKLRLMLEPFVRRGDGRAESVAEFATRRLGAEVVSNLIGPFLTGVYAGDERDLGAESVFGGLTEAERRYGSIVIGGLAAAMRRGERGLRGSYGASEGFGPLARHLAERLSEPPALNSRVAAIRRDESLWRVEFSGPSGDRSLRTRRVVVAAPAREAAELLRGADSEIAAGLDEIEYAPIVGISLGVDPADSRTPIEGFGFVVPRDAGPALLGCLFMSQLFPSRAPEGRELLQCLVGGLRWTEAVDLPDDVLIKRVQEDLDSILGLRGACDELAVTRWPRAIPQPDRRHPIRLERIAGRLAQLPGLRLAGAYLQGVGVSDALASGLRAAQAPTD